MSSIEHHNFRNSWEGHQLISARPPLSTREVEVVGLVIQGRSTTEIANLLTLSPDTIKTHLKNIFHKCRVHSRAQLTAWWYRKEALPAASANTAGDRGEQAAAQVRRWRLSAPRMALTAIIFITAIIASSGASTFQTVVAPNDAWTALTQTYTSDDNHHLINRGAAVCSQVRGETGSNDSYVCVARIVP